MVPMPSPAPVPGETTPGDPAAPSPEGRTVLDPRDISRALTRISKKDRRLP